MPTTTTPITISLQPGQPDEGMGYNPRKPLPYPIHVHPDWSCSNVPGYAMLGQDDLRKPRLVGFQRTTTPDPTGLVLADDDWLADPDVAVGMFPVFVTRGEMFNLTVPVTRLDR